MINRDNFCKLGIKNIVTPHLKMSRRDGSDEGSQHMILMRHKNYQILPLI